MDIIGYPTIGVGYTFDFKTFYQLENAFLHLTEMEFFFRERSMETTIC